jgi:hypothetical protein
MTDTIQRTTPESDDFSEKTEADLTPGDLCWVMTGDDAPTTVRNSRCMAIYTQGVGSNRWLLLVPNGDNPRHGTHGWVLGSNLTPQQMDRLSITRFVDTHRAWWAGNRTRFIETCVGHWCVTHQAFHATPDCPPVDPWARLAENRTADPSVVSGLRTQLAEAQQREAAAVKALEDFKTSASEILGNEADSHDLCETYDRIAERAGLYRRVREHEVVIEVTYRQVLRIEARSASVADDEVRHAAIEAGWYPSPVVDAELLDHEPPTDVAFKVIVEPPF